MRAKETKEEMNHWGFIKIRSFFTAKDTVKKPKRQRAGWERIFEKDILDKGLVYKIYKDLIQLDTQKQTIQS